MKWMNEHGVTVYIKLAAGSLFHRLATSKKDRPLLQKKGDVALMEYIMETLRYREVYYSQSKYTIKGEDLKPDALVKLIFEGEAQLK
jgi:shikimate kinase